MVTRAERERYIRTEVRPKLIRAIARAEAAMEPFKIMHARDPYRRLTSDDIVFIHAIASGLDFKVERVHDRLQNVRRARWGADPKRIFGQVSKSLQFAATLLSSITVARLERENDKRPSEALAMVLGDPDRAAELRSEGRGETRGAKLQFFQAALTASRGVYGEARVLLLQAATSLFYLTDPLKKKQVKLTQREWAAWSDPLTFEIKTVIQDQARLQAAEIGKYVEVVAPDGEVVFWASPVGDVPREVLSKRRGRAASFAATAGGAPRGQAGRAPTPRAFTRAEQEQWVTETLAGPEKTAPGAPVSEEELEALKARLAARTKGERAAAADVEETSFEWLERMQREGKIKPNPAATRGPEHDLVAMLWVES